MTGQDSRLSNIERDEAEYDPILAAFDAAEDDGYPTDEAREEYATLEAVVEGLRRDKRGAVEDWKRVLEWARPTPYRTDEDRINALGEIFDIATRRLVGGQ